MKKELYVTCKDMVNIQLIKVFKEVLEEVKINFAVSTIDTCYVYLKVKTNFTVNPEKSEYVNVKVNLKVNVTKTLENEEDSLLIAVINKEDVRNAWAEDWKERTLCRDKIIDQMQDRILSFINTYEEGELND